jgi:hypothetical protein
MMFFGYSGSYKLLICVSLVIMSMVPSTHNNSIKTLKVAMDAVV